MDLQGWMDVKDTIDNERYNLAHWNHDLQRLQHEPTGYA